MPLITKKIKVNGAKPTTKTKPMHAPSLEFIFEGRVENPLMLTI